MQLTDQERYESLMRIARARRPLPGMAGWQGDEMYYVRVATKNLRHRDGTPLTTDSDRYEIEATLRRTDPIYA